MHVLLNQHHLCVLPPLLFLLFFSAGDTEESKDPQVALVSVDFTCLWLVFWRKKKYIYIYIYIYFFFFFFFFYLDLKLKES